MDSIHHRPAHAYGHRLHFLESDAKYRLLFENGLDGVLLTSPTGAILAANPAACALFRMTEQELQRHGRDAVVNRDDPELHRLISQRQSSGSARGELEMKRSDGTTFDAEIASAQYVDDTGHTLTSIFVRDITEKKRARRAILAANARLEERVKRRTADLEMLNQDLESFALSVAHDLRAPLGVINAFSELLEEREAQVVSERGLHLIQRIRAAARRMSRMTDALLHLARLSHEGLKKETVDLAPVAREIIANLHDLAPGRIVEVTVDAPMEAFADLGLVTQLMENLLSNAWKFTSRRERAIIEIGRIDAPGTPRTFFVKDNGVGFDMEHASRLFRLFNRLHSHGDYEGTGVGLATAHKIVSRHGGTIRAEAVDGAGATFYFTLGAD
ncbi:sensor histidine kinase [Caenimonas aquaedulcis]|uniref:histidine kinase n=1 Tax=Caenimonas aquaedulcis TaxID=2793270 RepID=A0A931H916_9BURK|nr:ATP-binding protein [Caenimonas aquaedulcis]MBG9390622.1 PAS domain S-box protein [Caenimonas aquaedulcis]